MAARPRLCQSITDLTGQPSSRGLGVGDTSTIIQAASSRLALRHVLLAASLGISLATTGQAAPNNAAPYGCYRVKALEINIHASARTHGDVMGQARRGDLLLKLRRTCSPRGRWCPVATERGLERWAAKSGLEPVACPRKSRPAAAAYRAAGT